MEIDARFAEQALREALENYPQFAPYEPRLEWRPLLTGGAFMVGYQQHPPREKPHVWDFQNAVVKRYKQLAGVN